MPPGARWFLVPLAAGVALGGASPLSAQGRAGVAPMPYHHEVRTAVRPDPAPQAHAPAWGSWCDNGVACGGWNDPSVTPQAGSDPWSGSAVPSPARHRPDPNLRRVDGPIGGAERGPWWDDNAPAAPWQQPAWAEGGDAWSGAEDRVRHGWRAGWRGAQPGWGGVWWYGWGGDW